MEVAQQLFGGGDPKAAVRKWKSDMRKEQRQLDRQMRGDRAGYFHTHASPALTRAHALLGVNSQGSSERRRR